MTFQQALIYLRRVSYFDELPLDDDIILPIDDIIIPIDYWVMSNGKDNVNSFSLRVLDFYLGDYCHEYENLIREAEYSEEYVDGEKIIHYDCLAKRINHIQLLMLDLYDIFMSRGIDLREVWRRLNLPGTFADAADTDKILFNESYIQNNRGKELPRTYRIAAVWGLIDKLGLAKSKDRTILAAFVEAVTGGNIEARPQDTVAYKKPEQSAKTAAAEWLKKIGIE